MENTMKQPYLVLSQRTFLSHNHGQPVTEITLIGCKDRCQYRTYVDIQNKNYKFWQHIVNNKESGFAIRNLKIKDSSKYLISADSEPIIDIQADTKEELFADLHDIWQEEDQKSSSDKFRDLFE